MPLRFAVLEHTSREGVHFDVLLEYDGQDLLRTLQVERWPIGGGSTCACKELAPHRPMYLDYEGPVSGDRGSVRRVAGGTWREEGEFTVLYPTEGNKVLLRIDGANIEQM